MGHISRWEIGHGSRSLDPVTHDLIEIIVYLCMYTLHRRSLRQGSYVHGPTSPHPEYTPIHLSELQLMHINEYLVE